MTHSLRLQILSSETGASWSTANSGNISSTSTSKRCLAKSSVSFGKERILHKVTISQSVLNPSRRLCKLIWLRWDSPPPSVQAFITGAGSFYQPNWMQTRKSGDLSYPGSFAGSKSNIIGHQSGCTTPPLGDPMLQSDDGPEKRAQAAGLHRHGFISSLPPSISRLPCFISRLPRSISRLPRSASSLARRISRPARSISRLARAALRLARPASRPGGGVTHRRRRRRRRRRRHHRHRRRRADFFYFFLMGFACSPINSAAANQVIQKGKKEQVARWQTSSPLRTRRR